MRQTHLTSVCLPSFPLLGVAVCLSGGHRARIILHCAVNMMYAALLAAVLWQNTEVFSHNN